MASSDGPRKKRVLHLKRSLQKEELEHKLDDFSGSDTEDIDFSKEIRPISYYINDREKMIEEMFSIINNEKLKKMLPPSLKKYSLEEVKADCLVHLLGMSKKRIYATLQGRDLNSSSDSETDSSNSILGSDSSEEPQITSSTHVRSDVEEIDDTLDISVSKNDLDSLIQEKRSELSTSRRRGDKTRSQDKLAKRIKSERSPSLIEISDNELEPKKKKKDDKRSKKKPEKKSKPKRKQPKEKLKKVRSESSGESSEKEEDTTADGSVLVHSKKGKSLLEILELEMRARAIRALLEANNCVAESTSKLKVDPDSKEKKTPEKINTSSEDQPAENMEESDSFDVEVINEYSNEDAIIILDDLDEQIILEPNDTPEPLDKEPTKNGSNETEISKKDLDKEPPKSDPVDETPKSNPVEKETPKNDSTANTNTSGSNLTWPERWAESKGVKEIVQNSKLCANIRKRMRFARMLKQKQQEQQQNENQPDNPLLSELTRVEEGSVDQLQLLKLLEETTQKSNELSKKIGELDNENETEKEPEPANTITQNSDEKEEGEIEENIDETEEGSEELERETAQPNNKQDSSKSALDIEVVEQNISCHIDLTDL